MTKEKRDRLILYIPNRRHPLLSGITRRLHNRLIVFHSRKLKYLPVTATSTPPLLVPPRRSSTAVETPTHAVKTANLASAGNASFEFSSSGSGGLALLAFADHGFVALLFALDALHVHEVFLLEELATK